MPEQLQGIKTPIILVINKTDTVKNQEDILTSSTPTRISVILRRLSRCPPCGIRTPIRCWSSCSNYLPYGPQFYDEDTVTDQPMRQIAAELIREKALRLLDEEIPHGIAVTIEKMSERPRHHGCGSHHHL